MKYKQILPIMTSMLLALPLAAQTYGTDSPRHDRQDREQQWGQQQDRQQQDRQQFGQQDRDQRFGQQDRDQNRQRSGQQNQQQDSQRFGQQDNQRAYGQQQQYRQQQQRQFGQQQGQQGQQNPVRSSEIVGANVIGINGENIGQVEELYVDLDSGDVLGAVISSGGVMGLGGKEYRVPLHELNFNAEEKEIQLNWTQARLRNAPIHQDDSITSGDSEQAWATPGQDQQQEQRRLGQRGQSQQNQPRAGQRSQNQEQQRFGQRDQDRSQTQQRGW